MALVCLPPGAPSLLVIRYYSKDLVSLYSLFLGPPLKYCQERSQKLDNRNFVKNHGKKPEASSEQERRSGPGPLTCFPGKDHKEWLAVTQIPGRKAGRQRNAGVSRDVRKNTFTVSSVRWLLKTRQNKTNKQPNTTPQTKQYLQWEWSAEGLQINMNAEYCLIFLWDLRLLHSLHRRIF